MTHSKSDASASGDSIMCYTASAATALQELGDTTNIPYLKTIAGVSLLISDTILTVKSHRDQCIRMIEQIYTLLCAIINVAADSTASLPPSVLRNIARLCDTFQKVYSFVQRQLSSGLMKRLVRYKESNTLLAECTAELSHALGVFGVQSGITATALITDIQRSASERHKEVLDLLEWQDLGTDRPTIYGDRVRRSSSSISLLPACPKIFHGREQETAKLVKSLLQNVPTRAAILGPGGMGKSSLALITLHDSQVVARFGQHRYFIACDSAIFRNELDALIASHFGVHGDDTPLKSVIRYLSTITQPILLVLDNLETPWEPIENRSHVEESLSVLTDLDHLNLIVTMRGAERPGRVRWSRPMLQPLGPLANAAAKQTVLDIVDEIEDEAQLQALSDITDNVPLALVLLSNLVAFEGCTDVLCRWKSETTSLLSDGTDKCSSLDRSILISLSSPRMLTTPDALQLLSVLSILPDGISTEMLSEIPFPLLEVLRCKTTLLRTSLAYVVPRGRLKALVPIREYMRRTHPPPPRLIQPVRKYLYDIVKLFEIFRYSLTSRIVSRVSADMGNIRSLLELSLVEDPDVLKQTLYCIFDLVRFSWRTEVGTYDLSSIRDLVECSDDPNLVGEYLVALVFTAQETSSFRPILLRASQCFKSTGNISGQARAYNQLAHWCWVSGFNLEALGFAKHALATAKQTEDRDLEIQAMRFLAEIYLALGNLRDALIMVRSGQLLAREVGNFYTEAFCLFTHGRIFTCLGHCTQALFMFAEAEKLFEALGINPTASPWMIIKNMQAKVHRLKSEYAESRKLSAYILGLNVCGPSRAYAFLNIESIDIATGAVCDPITVEHNIAMARDAFIQAGYTGWSTLECQIALGDLRYHQGECYSASEIYRQVLSSKGAPVSLTLTCLQRLSDTTAAMPMHNEAFFHYTVLFLVFALKMSDCIAFHQAFRRLGDIFLRQQDEGTALDLFQLALGGLTMMNIHQERAECMMRIGDILSGQGKCQEARESWKAAKSLFVHASQAKDAAQCDRRLAEEAA